MTHAKALKRTKRFQQTQIEAALQKHFPICPDHHRQQIISKIRDRDWQKKTSLTQAISIVTHNHIRHQLTDYETWIGKHGITRNEARRMVKPELDHWFNYWHSGDEQGKEEPLILPAKRHP